MVHKLKTDPVVFQASWEEKKLFEMRHNDRDFQVGDEIILQETVYTGTEMKEGKPLRYTGREINFGPINYILYGPVYGLQDVWVIMS